MEAIYLEQLKDSLTKLFTSDKRHKLIHRLGTSSTTLYVNPMHKQLGSQLLGVIHCGDTPLVKCCYVTSTCDIRSSACSFNRNKNCVIRHSGTISCCYVYIKDNLFKVSSWMTPVGVLVTSITIITCMCSLLNHVI